jgi:hypothetical protein
MIRAAIDEIADQARSLLHSSQYRLLIYGSSALEPSKGRDIDLLAIVPAAGVVDFHTIYVSGEDKPCNFYVVPEDVFIADALSLLYGGFYAHKVALSFREIGVAGKVMHPARFFWTLARVRAERELDHELEAADLMRWVHADILLHRPTFLRPLSKFAISTDRVNELRRWVQRLEAEKDDLIDYELPSPDEYRSAKETALWRFWREYNKYKGCSGIWSDKSVLKMRSSLQLDFAHIARAYFLKGQS